MFCYLLLPWSKNYDFCFAGIYTYFVNIFMIAFENGGFELSSTNYFKNCQFYFFYQKKHFFLANLCVI